MKKRPSLGENQACCRNLGICPLEIGLIFLCFSGGWGRKILSNCRFVTLIILEDLATSVDVDTFEPCSPHLWSCSKRKTLYESWVSHVLCWSFWRWFAQSLRVEPAEQIVFGNDVTLFPTCSKTLTRLSNTNPTHAVTPPLFTTRDLCFPNPMSPSLQYIRQSSCETFEAKKVAKSGGPLQHVFIWPLGMFPSPNMKPVNRWVP